jgi:hypothetical protein
MHDGHRDCGRAGGGRGYNDRAACGHTHRVSAAAIAHPGPAEPHSSATNPHPYPANQNSHAAKPDTRAAHPHAGAYFLTPADSGP